MKTLITSSIIPSNTELLMLWVATFFLGDMTCVSRAGLGSEGFCEVRRTNDDAFRRGVPRRFLTCDGKAASAILEVLTMGAGAEVPAIGRIMTSPPSNVSAESRELSSVSGLTASVLTITGYSVDKSSFTYSDDKAKSLKSEDLV